MMKIKTLMTLLLFVCMPSLEAVANTVDIREWLVPWEDSAPTDAHLDARGRVWFVSTEGDYVGNFSFERDARRMFDLRPDNVFMIKASWWLNP